MRAGGRAARGLAAAVVVGIASHRGPGRRLDERLYAAANTRGQHPALDRLFLGVTELGSLWASVAASGVLAAAGRRRAAARALGAAGITWVLGQALKRAFVRPRPYDSDAPGRLLIGRPRGTSWPSSHPAVVLAFITVAARDLLVPRPLRAGLASLAGAVAASRVYLGVHYPSDVAGGLLLGRAVADAWPSHPGLVR